ncbi:hypothetical protein ACFFX0_32835 [Citricoccus parietis]|uniref:Uncharacterized protein n=1 Tax=Citricoccus parietis TaxID=592307 RepID=A0ABV5G9S7_9MICC
MGDLDAEHDAEEEREDALGGFVHLIVVSVEEIRPAIDVRQLLRDP